MAGTAATDPRLEQATDRCSPTLTPAAWVGDFGPISFVLLHQRCQKSSAQRQRRSTFRLVTEVTEGNKEIPSSSFTSLPYVKAQFMECYLKFISNFDSATAVVYPSRRFPRGRLHFCAIVGLYSCHTSKTILAKPYPVGTTFSGST